MSENPAASIKTLARYEPDTVYIGTGEYVAECVRADDGDYYLAADVDAAIEALQAEIEALRDALAALKAENERLRGAIEECHALSVARWKRLLAAEAENERLRAELVALKKASQGGGR